MNNSLHKIYPIVGIGEFRAALKTYFAKAKKQPIIVSEKRGGESFVVLSQKLYNTLIEAYEDESDAQELSRLVKADKGKSKHWVPLSKLK